MPEALSWARAGATAFLLCLGAAAAAHGAPPVPPATLAYADDDDGDEVDSTRVDIPVPEAAQEEDEARPPLWLEVYSEATRSRHEDHNTSGFADFKAGRRIPLALPVDIYAKARVYRDQADFYWNNLAMGGAGIKVTVPMPAPISLSFFAQAMTGSYLRTRSGAQGMQGLQDRINETQDAVDGASRNFQSVQKALSDARILAGYNVENSDTTEAGRQQILSLLAAADDSVAKHFLDTLSRIDAKLARLQSSQDTLQDAMDNIALVPSGSVTEFLTGAVFQHAWGGPVNGASGPWFAFPLRFWGDIYSDCIFQALRRHVMTRRGDGTKYSDSTVRLNNLIYYCNPDVGVLLLDGRAGSVAAYVTAYFWFDSHRDWWNNLYMAGPGLRWQPLPLLDFAVAGEYLRGRYYREARAEDPLPYARAFSDFRLTANFWYGLGL